MQLCKKCPTVLQQLPCDDHAIISVPFGHSLALLKQQDFNPFRLTTWSKPMLYYAESSRKFRGMKQSWKIIWHS